MKQEDTLVTVASFSSDHEAEIARGILEDSGIQAYVHKDDCGGMLPQLQAIRGVRLKVNAQDRQKALEILEME
jgi:hypothetical protein